VRKSQNPTAKQKSKSKIGNVKEIQYTNRGWWMGGGMFLAFFFWLLPVVWILAFGFFLSVVSLTS
jgi:hypothetical protein